MWCHKRCYKGQRSVECSSGYIICPTCIDPKQSTQKERYLAGTQLEYVNQFQYLGDVLSCKGNAETAVRNRIKAAWNNWRVLAAVMMRRDIPLNLRLSLYRSTIRPVLLYGSETWPMTQALENQIRRTDLKMLKWIQRLHTEDRISTEEILKRSNMLDIGTVMQQHRLRYFGHVKRSQDHLIQEVVNLEVEGKRPRGRPRKTWCQTIQSDMREFNLAEIDASDRSLWKSRLMVQPPFGDQGP